MPGSLSNPPLGGFPVTRPTAAGSWNFDGAESSVGPASSGTVSVSAPLTGNGGSNAITLPPTATATVGALVVSGSASIGTTLYVGGMVAQAIVRDVGNAWVLDAGNNRVTFPNVVINGTASVGGFPVLNTASSVAHTNVAGLGAAALYSAAVASLNGLSGTSGLQLILNGGSVSASATNITLYPGTPATPTLNAVLAAGGTSTNSATVGTLTVNAPASAGIIITSTALNVAIGSSASATGYKSAAFGFRSTASNQYASALGVGATASGYGSTASGYSAQATGLHSTASGYFASALADNSTAIGYGASATSANTIVLGMSGQTVYVPGSLRVAGGVPAADGTYATGAKLTGGGVNGSITIKQGIITAITAAT